MANTYDHLVSPVVQFLDDDGNPLSGGKVFTWVNDGGTTHKTSYTTPAGVANTNPIVLNSRGECTICGSGYYRLGVYPATEVADPPTGAAVWTRDDVLLGTDDFLALKDDDTVATMLTTLGFSAMMQLAKDDTTAAQFFATISVNALMQLFLATTTAATARNVLQIGGSNIAVLTASGNWAIPAGITADSYLVIELWGAGGGGAGTPNAEAQPGGGGGGYSSIIKNLTAAEIAAGLVAYLVGAGGAGGTAGQNAGTIGGTSSFGSHLSATGGAGATSVAGSAGIPGVGGVGSTGNVNLTGGKGSPNVATGWGGNGGIGAKGGSGGSGGVVSGGAGATGAIFGGGGGGGAGAGGAAAGGTGGAGRIVIWY